MADETTQPTEPVTPVVTPPSEMSKLVEDFFIQIEDLAKQTGKVIADFVTKVVKIKFSILWQKEKGQIQDRITKGLEDGKTTTLSSKK